MVPRIKYYYIILFGLIFIGTLSFSIQVYNEPMEIKYPAYFGNRTYIPENNPTTTAGVELGRMLFYEKSLSANNTISCASCHKQELAFTDGKTFSPGFDGTMQTRNTMSLANLLWVENFFWDGRIAGLEEQARTPLSGQHEMGQSLAISATKLSQKRNYVEMFAGAFVPGHINAQNIVRALAQFERTLVSADSRYDQYLQGRYRPTQDELNGIDLFFGSTESAKTIRNADCAHCHGGPKTYTELFQNNGLDSVFNDAGRELVTGQLYDRGRFRVVSLRNIALTAPYMHDGRFKNLEQVVDHYSDQISSSATLSPFLGGDSGMHGGKLLLNANEKKGLLAFLHMLTDSSFINNKQFSDPFKTVSP